MGFSTIPARNSENAAAARSQPHAEAHLHRSQLIALHLQPNVALARAALQLATLVPPPVASKPRPPLWAAAVEHGVRSQQAPIQARGIITGGHLGFRSTGGATDSPRVGDR
jgi:hypothetical protein